MLGGGNIDLFVLGKQKSIVFVAPIFFFSFCVLGVENIDFFSWENKILFAPVSCFSFFVYWDARNIDFLSRENIFVCPHEFVFFFVCCGNLDLFLSWGANRYCFCPIRFFNVLCAGGEKIFIFLSWENE